MQDTDLLNSSFALPVCPPDQFGALRERIVSSLRSPKSRPQKRPPGRDEWATKTPSAFKDWASPPAMSFHTSDEVAEFLRDFDVERLDEIDQ